MGEKANVQWEGILTPAKAGCSLTNAAFPRLASGAAVYRPPSADWFSRRHEIVDRLQEPGD